MERHQLAVATSSGSRHEERLRPLDQHPEWEKTLRAFVRHGYDRRATATALNLHLHPNTVDYRLGRITIACGPRPRVRCRAGHGFAAVCVRDLERHRTAGRGLA
jgi:sugar diacid utilization regulator